MTWRLPDTYHSAGHGRGTATLKFYEGWGILAVKSRLATVIDLALTQAEPVVGIRQYGELMVRRSH